MRQQDMFSSIAEVVPFDGTWELLRVVWMEVAIACFAAIVYFTMIGWFAPQRKKSEKCAKAEDVEAGGRQKTSSRGLMCEAESTLCQLVNKDLRQGRLNEALASLRTHPKFAAGSVPANVAPRLLMAVAKASNFNDVMVEMRDFAAKIEARSLEAAVTEAMKNKDIEACHRLHLMSGLLSVLMSQRTFEVLAQAYGTDVVGLRSLVEESEAPLSRSFAKLVLEACTRMKEVDLAAEVFEKVADSDAAVLRKVVEKAASRPSDSIGDGTSRDDVLHAKEIRMCGKSGDLAAAFGVFDQKTNSNSLSYNAILEACVACGDLSRALEMFSKAKQEGLVDVVSYNTVVKGYVAQGDVIAAKALVTEISARGMSPTHASFHTILNFLSVSEDRAGVWSLLADMQAAGVSPNTVTCSILLKGKLNSSSDVDKILRIVRKLDEPLDEVLFSTLAEACIRTKKLDVLAEYMSSFSGQGNRMVLSAPTYGSMIKAFGQMQDVKRVKELWEDMVKHGVQPTAITLGCMVEALVMNKRTADAWALALEIRSCESTADLVNTVIYSTILKGFANAKETSKVMDLYAEMKAHNIQPNTITFNTMLNAFAQGGAMNRVAALLEDMKTATPPVEPDIVTYSTLVKGFCNSGNLDRALCILKDMQEDGKNSPDEVMYNSLLDGCSKEHRLDDALKLLDEMKKSGIAPSNYTLSIMVKLLGRCRRLKQALSLVEEVNKEYKVKINIQVYTCLIQACFNNRQATKAIAVHDQMIEEGLFPDEMTYSALVKGCLQASLVDKAVHLVKCAHGVAHPNAGGRPAGVNARCLDDLVTALGGKESDKAKSLLVEIGKLSARNEASRQVERGSGKNDSTVGAPWRQRRA